MKNYLQLITLFLFLWLSHATPLLASTIDETKIEFPLNTTSLMQGNIHTAVTLADPHELESIYPIFHSIDYAKIGQLYYVKLMLSKYAFYVAKPISAFSKEEMFNTSGFERISQNTTVTSAATPVSEHTITFTISKNIVLFNISAAVDFSYYSTSEFNLLPLEKEIVSAFQKNSSSKPQIITLQRAYDFSKFFQDSTNICGYWQAGAGTIMSCYTISSINRSTYNHFRFFSNFVKQLRSEILYSINAIRMNE
ncbi:MAG: hypothetical protein HQK50_00485 [Oligoflexia bacterium]|nr:hypothetical protein [Oligoflexia bacterium]MBF0364012.1 hypothetical protein [Oligoflexia bacterium]